MGKTAYPRVEGTGFVRVQIWLPGPLPLCTLPMTPAGFQSHAIPYTPVLLSCFSDPFLPQFLLIPLQQCSQIAMNPLRCYKSKFVI